MTEKGLMEEVASHRKFSTVQDELKSLVNKPQDVDREEKLIFERAEILREPRERKIFEGIRTAISSLQGSSKVDFPASVRAVKNLNEDDFMRALRAQKQVELKGLDLGDIRDEIIEYRDVTVLVMNHALLVAEGKDYEAKKLEREIQLRAWNTVPRDSYSAAIEYVQSKRLSARERKTRGANDDGKATRLLERLVLSSEEQNQLLRRGYRGFIQILRANTPVDPRTNRMNLPPWFEAQSPEFQDMLDFMMNVNYIAHIKRTTGAVDQVFGLKGALELNSRDFERMWKTLPGFKEAMTTMVADIFDSRHNDHFVISDDGYTILKSNDSFRDYRERLAQKIGVLIGNVHKDALEKKFGVANLGHAEAAVATAYNFLFAGGAFDSGDEKGQMNPGQSWNVSLGFRMFFMPMKRGEQKWVFRKKETTLPGVTQEDFGGALGRWMLWNVAHTKGFKEKFLRGEIGFFPKRAMYSLFELERFSSEEDGADPQFAEKSLAEVLLESANGARSTRGGVRLPSGDIAFSQIDSGADMFSGYIENGANYMWSLYSHLTSGDPKNRLRPDVVANLLVKLRKDKLLNSVARDEDFITALVIMAASPEKGLVGGTDKLLLDVNESAYDSIVTSATSDERLFGGTSPDFRRRLIERLNALDSGSTKGGIARNTGLFSKDTTRFKIRTQAGKKTR